MKPEQEKDLCNRFSYHPPKGDQLDRYAEIRHCALAFALFAASATPVSREQSLGFTKLEEAVMHFNAAIARNE